jgi:thymidylate synthase
MLLREGRLNWTQFMRSNDALWGTPYNVIQWTQKQIEEAVRSDYDRSRL